MLFRSVSQSRYGEVSAVVVGSTSSASTFKFSEYDPKQGALFNAGNSSAPVNDPLNRSKVASTPVGVGTFASNLITSQGGSTLVGFRGSLDVQSSMKISALRSATALQKYKEIQNSNDPDFANQVLAHFGIKPKVDSRTSIFIGGDDKTLTINPQVNTNFLNGGAPDIKAIGVGDLSAGCKFTATTYGMIIGIYRAVPQLDYAHVGIDRNLFKTDATDFPIPELDSIGMQTQYRCELSAPMLGLC